MKHRTGGSLLPKTLYEAAACTTDGVCVCALQASRRTVRWYQGRGPHPLAWPPWLGARREDVLLEAVGGLLLWRVRANR